MSELLNMAPATYSKLKTNHTQLSAEVLEKIADLLGILPLTILKDSIAPNSNDSTKNRNLAATNAERDLKDKIISAKDSEIGTLKQALENCQKLIQQQAFVIEKFVGK